MLGRRRAREQPRWGAGGARIARDAVPVPAARALRGSRRAAARQAGAARAQQPWGAAPRRAEAVGRAGAAGHAAPKRSILPSMPNAAPTRRADRAPSAAPAPRGAAASRGGERAPVDQPPPPALRMLPMSRPPLGAAAALVSSSAPTVAAVATARAMGAIWAAMRGEPRRGRVRNAAESPPRPIWRLRGPPALGCTGAFWWLRAARVSSSPAMRREGTAARCNAWLWRAGRSPARCTPRKQCEL